MADDEQGPRLYEYAPTLAGASVFCSLFALTSALHAFQLVQNRTWYMIGFLIAGLLELVGYAARTTSATEERNKWSTAPFIVQSMSLLIAPTFAAASTYSILGRIIACTNAEAYSIIKRRWITVFFVFSDVFAFLMISVGGGLTASSIEDASQIGKNTIVGGLILQLSNYSFFFIVAASFYQRMDALPPVKKQRHSQINWQHHLKTLFIVSAFFVIRYIFRIIEVAQGTRGYLYKHEVFIYLFDATPVALIMLYMNWQYPLLNDSRVAGGLRIPWIRMRTRERAPVTAATPLNDVS